MATIKSSEALVLVSKQNGIVVIPTPTPLTRLNYFDGKFLRASDLKAEQDYLRQLVRQSNQAGGAGVAHGFDLTLGGGDRLLIGAGLAIDTDGRVLLLPQETAVSVQELIDKSQDLERLFGKSNVVHADGFELCETKSSSETPVNTAQPSNLYLIVISSAEALCGEEDVFGKLCEEACATSTDRPFVVEGLVVRALPLVLQTSLPSSKAVALTQTHLRSRVAAAYFEDERRRVASLISRFGLEQETWCHGADTAAASGVALGVLARAGSTTTFLDPWIARRERIDTPARRYWQWRMRMRPWDVFLAQILQFQCQLHDLFRKLPTPGGDFDPCGGARVAIDDAAATIVEIKQFYESTTRRFTALNVNLDEAMTFKGGLSRLSDLNNKLVAVGQSLAAVPGDRLLIRGGVVELPSAGYLPVVPGAGATINQQVRQMMGEGVDLRFCVVTPDYIAHALEEAQHMERISLLQGLEDSNSKPEVDILVPEGEILEQKQLSPGLGFEAHVTLATALLASRRRETMTSTFSTSVQVPVSFHGAARAEVLPSGGGAFYLSAAFEPTALNPAATVVESGASTGEGAVEREAAMGRDVVFLPELSRISFSAASGVKSRPSLGLWISLRSEANVFKLERGDTTNVNARAVAGADISSLSTSGSRSLLFDVELNGLFEVTEESTLTGSDRAMKGRFRNAQLSFQGRAFGTDEARRTITVDLQVTVTVTKGAQIEIVLEHETGLLTLASNWDRRPLEVGALVSFKDKEPRGTVGDDGVTLAESQVKENPDVLSDKNASHRRARAALEIIAAALNDAAFADSRGRLLFPPPPKPTDEILVRGTADWVLFHRRRNRTCAAAPAPPPTPRPSRRYALFHATLEDVGLLDVISKALRTPGAASDAVLQRFKFEQVDVVEFASGVATLSSSPTQIQQDWQLKSPGELLSYGAIASTESAAAEGEALAGSRLRRTQQVVSAISKPAQRMLLEVLPSVPAPLSVQGTDGAIVLITNQGVQTVCHTVFRAENTAALDLASGLIQSATSAEQMKAAIETAKLSHLGEVLIQEGTSDISDEQSLAGVVEAWKARGGGVASRAVIVCPQPTPQEEQLRKEQSAKIREKIGTVAGISEPGIRLTSAPLPTACPVFSIIAVQEPTVTRNALVVFAFTATAGRLPAQGSTQTKVKFINNVPQGEELKNAMRGLPPGTSIGRVRGVTLAGVAAPLEADAQQRLNAAVTALKEAGGIANPQANALVLSDADRNLLTSHGISIAGFDEVIYLEMPG
jgi:hypothetical protein